MAGKRKRDAFSAHEKLVHKSCSLLQREAKKVRTFLVRKVVQQLKQLRQQLTEPVEDAAKQQKREQKLRHSIERFEREHTALKTLDLQKLVARARLQTGLDKPQPQTEENEHEEVEEWDEEGSDEESSEESEGEQETEKDESVVQQRSIVAEKEAEEKEQQKEPTKQSTELEEKLMDRVLAHKQIVPLLDAIKKLVEKEEKEAEKKRRAQEKRALKRGRHESLVGNTGRSGVAPTSLFLGSLSGRGGLDDDLDMGMDGYGTMAGADDDIAEFLGEKKKKKNRPGQMARRMKAIRKEEALKRKEDRAKGIFVPHKDNSTSVGKYGLSERPKKAKPKAKQGKGDKADKQKSRSGKPSEAAKAELQKQKQRVAPAPVEAAHPSWLAKQKQKEKEKISLTAFSGKKITFD
ncbi:hypothetical protein F441_19797 [Phytophthora nicotianae CJ01A1]|uniref:Bud22 domain-containing protein n=2 Tax=Phytophthora nicotianae TaxID=4792 RepID=W2HYX8_PHYNI|nr:hypothetical protein L915_19397 [Phytophthora nicotianae]ETL27149.1 hypothetical protein L916_19290 [Phytophthora nicotianae]ETP03230.1 hypothetical protein F441_19797 [Phytophthora nicotianae CJ01A1]